MRGGEGRKGEKGREERGRNEFGNKEKLISEGVRMGKIRFTKNKKNVKKVCITPKKVYRRTQRRTQKRTQRMTQTRME